MPRDIGTFIDEVTRFDGAGGAFIWMLGIDFEDNSAVYLTSNPATLTYSGQSWTPYPFEVGEIREDGEGEISGVSVTGWDGDSEIASRLDAYRGFDRWRVTLHLANLADGASVPGVLISHRFRVNDITTESGRVTMVLGEDEINAIQLPHNYFDPNRCQAAYRGALCGYAGALPTCDRSMWGENGCQVHENMGRFRGAPGLRSLIT